MPGAWSANAPCWTEKPRKPPEPRRAAIDPDVVSDIALLSPLAFVAPFSSASIASLVCLAAISEFAGVTGTILGGTRRLEGALGKADRSIVLALVAIAIAACGRLPKSAWAIVPALCLGLVITIWNRLRFAFAERSSVVE
jgi:hypothetical protein